MQVRSVFVREKAPMKIYYAPSGKRMIPYPPVAPAILASALESRGVLAKVIDLEMEAWVMNQSRGFWPDDRAMLEPYSIISHDWRPQLTEFACTLSELAEYVPGEPVAISTMGYEQLACTMILTSLALRNGSRVILGGQFWTEKTAKRVLSIIKDPNLTIVTSDGFESIVEWHQGVDAPVNSFRWNEAANEVISGKRKSVLTSNFWTQLEMHSARSELLFRVRCFQKLRDLHQFSA